MIHLTATLLSIIKNRVVFPDPLPVRITKHIMIHYKYNLKNTLQKISCFEIYYISSFYQIKTKQLKFTKMKSLKPYLKLHSTMEDAVNRTTESNVTAVVVKTYSIDTLVSTEYYSYKTKWDGNPEALREDFPLSLGSNQSIEEIDVNNR